MNKTSSTKNLKPESMNNIIIENNRLSSEIVSLKGKMKDYEMIEKEMAQFQIENQQLKTEINNLQARKSKETEFNEILKEFETNFRNKIMEVEAEKEYYKGLNKEYLTERNNFRLEKEEKIYELELTISQLQEKLKEKEREKVSFSAEKKEKNEIEKVLNEEKDRLFVDLREKTVEISVWKEKYYELLAEKDKIIKTNNSFNSNHKEIDSLKIQTKELMEKMDILNRIIESHAAEKENLETELKIYKQKMKVFIFLNFSIEFMKFL